MSPFQKIEGSALPSQGQACAKAGASPRLVASILLAMKTSTAKSLRCVRSGTLRVLQIPASLETASRITDDNFTSTQKTCPASGFQGRGILVGVFS